MVAPTSIAELFPWLVGAAALIGALAVIWKAIRRARTASWGAIGDAVKIRDSIIGRPAMVDSITGEEKSPALPGIGQRMDTVERAVATLADQHRVLDDHEDRLKRLEVASAERIVNRSDSAQAWRAMTAAIEATPGEDPEL